jgi:hypothetical protein
MNHRINWLASRVKVAIELAVVVAVFALGAWAYVLLTDTTANKALGNSATEAALAVDAYCQEADPEQRAILYDEAVAATEKWEREARIVGKGGPVRDWRKRFARTNTTSPAPQTHPD